jgi:hypothetical protein
MGYIMYVYIIYKVFIVFMGFEFVWHSPPSDTLVLGGEVTAMPLRGALL